jgi:hypothetical protein
MGTASYRMIFWPLVLGATLASGAALAASSEDNAARALKAKEITEDLREKRAREMNRPGSEKLPAPPWAVLLEDKDTLRPELEARKNDPNKREVWVQGAEEQQQQTAAWQDAVRQQQRRRDETLRKQLELTRRAKRKAEEPHVGPARTGHD